MRVKVQKWGNSLGLRLPKTLAAEAGIEQGSELELRIDNGSVVATPAVVIPTLEELVNRITPETLHGEVWPDKTPVGREILDPW